MVASLPTNMKTYDKTIMEPRLKIRHDSDAESPRQWDNLGYFVTKESRHESPDGNRRHPSHGDYQPAWLVQEIMERTADEAKNADDHKRLIKAELKKEGENVLVILPVVRHEHGNVSYKLGTAQGFDASNCGFYIVTEKSAKVLGTPKSSFLKVIEQELETYTAWANGEVYGYELYDENGVLENSCWGFYDIEDIKADLPVEWANENLSDYLI